MLREGDHPHLRRVVKQVLPSVILEGEANLFEAIDTGFKFALVRKTGPAQYTTLHKPVTCKDYFQDAFWSEHHGKPIKVYGFEWSPGRIDKDASTFTMVLLYTTPLAEFGRRLEALVEPFAHALKFTAYPVLPTNDPTKILFRFDGRWTRTAPLISSLTSIIRSADSFDTFKYTVASFLDAMEKGNFAGSRINTADMNRAPMTVPRLRILLKGIQPTGDYQNYATAGDAHCSGIMGSRPSAWGIK